jgi:hypothetical protein
MMADSFAVVPLLQRGSSQRFSQLFFLQSLSGYRYLNLRLSHLSCAPFYFAREGGALLSLRRKTFPVTASINICG